MRTLRDQPDLFAIPVLLALLAFFTPSDLRFSARPVLQGLSVPAHPDCPQLTPVQKQKLRSQYQQLNPFTLKEQIEHKLKTVFDKARVR